MNTQRQLLDPEIEIDSHSLKKRISSQQEEEIESDTEMMLQLEKQNKRDQYEDDKI